LQVLHALREVGMTLAQYTADMLQYPQTLLNVRLVGKVDLAAPVIQDAVIAAEQVLGETGRVVLRASGTEPLIRVMVESQCAQQARQQAELIAVAVRKAAA
ncbi:MAG: phosphoglucosamine mutase, partial [Sulfuriferula sp.]